MFQGSGEKVLRRAKMIFFQASFQSKGLLFHILETR